MSGVLEPNGSLTVDQKAQNMVDDQLEKFKVERLADILRDIQIAKLKFDKQMEDFQKQSDDIKVATVTWFNYEDWKKRDERRRERDECEPCRC